MLRLFNFNSPIVNSQSWTYLDDRGGRHQINLYHSPRVRIKPRVAGVTLLFLDKTTIRKNRALRQHIQRLFAVDKLPIPAETCLIATTKKPK